MRLFVALALNVYHHEMQHALLSIVLLIVSYPNLAIAKTDDGDLAAKIESLLPPHVGACVMATKNGKIIFEHAYGLADIETKAPCTSETNFRMASVSKQFTATAVLLLADRGKLSLDDKLTKFFPGFPKYGDVITVKHLLTHTSGLTAYEDIIPKGTSLQLTDYDVLHLLMDTKEPKFAAGSKFEYSNSGYTLLGLIVEQVAQKPFHDFMASEIFRPLGMDESVVYQRGLNEVPHRALGHEQKDGEWSLADQSLTSAVRGDGGVYTSLRGYHKWLAGIDDQKLLKKATYEAMFSPQVLTDRHGSHYGYGWFIDEYRGEPRIHHNGDTRGFREVVQRFPERHAALLVQLNGEVAGQSVNYTEVGEHIADALIFNKDR
ncbi:MAG TPA: serine hydrolase domain-containing protein [Lacipirellulaceae bacterium]|nr:serine hydrolase domain-containing protein [Lacipirellulaceae bacterium]